MIRLPFMSACALFFFAVATGAAQSGRYELVTALPDAGKIRIYLRDQDGPVARAFVVTVEREQVFLTPFALTVKKLKGNRTGVTLIETLMALVIHGLFAHDRNWSSQ